MSKATELTGLENTIIDQLGNFGIRGILIKELIFENTNIIEGFNEVDESREECRIVRNPATGELEYICTD